jgi:hypothetical protein
MADPRAFLSFDFDHNLSQKILFAGQGAKESPTPFTVQDWSSKVPLLQSEWERQIAEKISRCNLMIVLVGRNMASASGVVKEIQFASNANVPYFGVYVDGANTGSNLPTGLARNRTTGWDWGNIADAIRLMMKEGKNA